VSSVLAIMKRVLVFPAYTVAAVNGTRSAPARRSHSRTTRA
jgi:hypothetical protein